jgi:hypothetical protein
MYDGGNQLYVSSVGGSSSGLLQYTQACGGTPTAAGVADVYYATCKIEGDAAGGVFVANFWSASASIGGFRVAGNLGADGSGSVFGNSVALAAGERGVVLTQAVPIISCRGWGASLWRVPLQAPASHRSVCPCLGALPPCLR